MKGLGRKLGKKFEDAMSSASFAEAGEFETAREMVAGSKRILLVLTGRESDSKALKYAINTAQRTNAALEVLVTSSSDGARLLLEKCAEETHKSSVGLEVANSSGCIKEAIISHTNKRRDIICVVVESSGMLNVDCTKDERRLEGVWKKLGCPLVLVSET